MQNPEWLFFDLGSTLIGETAAYARRIRETVDGSPVTVPEFEAAFKDFSAQGFDGYAAAAAQFGLSKAPWHTEEEFPYADVEAVLRALRRRGYRLGVIANQQIGTERRLLEWNLLQFFDVIAASAEVGAAKPDHGIFLWALRHADCAPQNAAMIGDRIDNDILPAKALGMKTVRILSGPSASYRPADDPADRTVPSLPDLLLIF
jgi:putative hydrolase of the HAD superfamily